MKTRVEQVVACRDDEVPSEELFGRRLWTFRRRWDAEVIDHCAKGYCARGQDLREGVRIDRWDRDRSVMKLCVGDSSRYSELQGSSQRNGALRRRSLASSMARSKTLSRSAEGLPAGLLSSRASYDAVEESVVPSSSVELAALGEKPRFARSRSAGILASLGKLVPDSPPQRPHSPHS
jgi:hypothetical protein